MNIRKVCWVLALILVVITSVSASAQSQADPDREACDEQNHVDAELNRVYQQVISDYQSDSIFIEKLRAAQRAWIVYRDAQLSALYPAREPQRAYGSAHRMCRCQALTELILQRTEELRRWVKGLEAGDVCAGSIKIRGYTGTLQRKPGLRRILRNVAAKKPL